MKIIVVGTGYVGLPHSAVCAESGHEVIPYDIDKARIGAYQSRQLDEIERYGTEPGLAPAIAENRNN